jgi:membrane protease YdiL (CAAX protease family)
MKRIFSFNWFTPALLILLWAVILVIVVIIAMLICPPWTQLVVRNRAIDGISTQTIWLLTLLIAWRFFPLDKKTLDLKIETNKLPFIILAGCSLSAANIGITYLCGIMPPANPYDKHTYTLILGFMGSCFAAPIIEELFFRGMIFKNLSKRYSFWVSSVYSSLLFAIIHLSLEKFIGLFITGMALCWLLNKYKKIIYCIIIHFIIGLVAQIIVPL